MVKLVVPEPGSEQIAHLLGLHNQEQLKFVVPTLMYYEACNALRFSKNRGGASVAQLMQRLYSLELEEIPASADLLGRAAEQASLMGSSVYDAVYLTIAKDKNGVMVTADEKFDKKARSRHVAMLDKVYDEFSR